MFSANVWLEVWLVTSEKSEEILFDLILFWYKFLGFGSSPLHNDSLWFNFVKFCLQFGNLKFLYNLAGVLMESWIQFSLFFSQFACLQRISKILFISSNIKELYSCHIKFIMNYILENLIVRLQEGYKIFQWQVL